jgi:hypothetical protein
MAMEQRQIGDRRQAGAGMAMHKQPHLAILRCAIGAADEIPDLLHMGHFCGLFQDRFPVEKPQQHRLPLIRRMAIAAGSACPDRGCR